MKKIYLFALLFAILTGIGVYSYLNGLKTAPAVKTASVLIAAERIPERTLITEDMVEVVILPVEAVNQLALHSSSDAVGKVTNVSIEVNEQVLQTKVDAVDSEKSGLSFSIPQGKRAISISVSDVSGVSGYLQKGDSVDILASLLLDSGDGTGTKISKTVMLLQNIEILATATASENAAGAAGYSTITLAVADEEAMRLFYAQINGQVTLLLRPHLETTVEDFTEYAP